MYDHVITLWIHGFSLLKMQGNNMDATITTRIQLQLYVSCKGDGLTNRSDARGKFETAGCRWTCQNNEGIPFSIIWFQHHASSDLLSSSKLIFTFKHGTVTPSILCMYYLLISLWSFYEEMSTLFALFFAVFASQPQNMDEVLQQN